jgi:hypothetical protein
MGEVSLVGDSGSCRIIRDWHLFTIERKGNECAQVLRKECRVGRDAGWVMTETFNAVGALQPPLSKPYRARIVPYCRSTLFTSKGTADSWPRMRLGIYAALLVVITRGTKDLGGGRGLSYQSLSP